MVTIIQGGKKSFVVRVLSQATGDPYSLTGVTEITACFMKADGTELMKTFTASGGITVVTALLGKLAIALTAAETALLAPVDSAVLELAIDLGSGPEKVQIPDAYEVIASVC